MASFSLPFPPYFSYLKLREGTINLTFYQSVFYHILSQHLRLRSQRDLCLIPVFHCCGGRMPRMTGLPRGWLALLFPTIHPSSCGKGFFLFVLPSLGSLCMKRKLLNDKPRLQVPCRGWRPARAAAAPTHPSLAWRNGRMHVTSPQPASHSLPCLTPTPGLFSLCGLFLNHLSCLCAGFLRRNSTVQWTNPFGVCGRQGREDMKKSPLNNSKILNV